MSTVIRRRRSSRLQLGPYKRHELLTGEVKIVVQGYSGYANGRDTDLSKFISDEMRRDWANNRERTARILEIGQLVGRFPGLLAMAVWVREGGLSALGSEAFGLKGRTSQRGQAVRPEGETHPPQPMGATLPPASFLHASAWVFVMARRTASAAARSPGAALPQAIWLPERRTPAARSARRPWPQGGWDPVAIPKLRVCPDRAAMEPGALFARCRPPGDGRVCAGDRPRCGGCLAQGARGQRPDRAAAATTAIPARRLRAGATWTVRQPSRSLRRYEAA